MSFWRSLFGTSPKDPETERRELSERITNSMMGIEGVIDLDSSGHPRCPKCGAKHLLSAEQMRTMMTKMDEGTVPMIICHTCDAKIRVRQ